MEKTSTLKDEPLTRLSQDLLCKEVGSLTKTELDIKACMEVYSKMRAYGSDILMQAWFQCKIPDQTPTVANSLSHSKKRL